MDASKLPLPVFVGLVLGVGVAVACNTPSEESAEQGAAAKTVGSSGVTVTTRHESKSVRAKNIDKDISEMETCDVSLDLVEVSGTAHDEAINALLRGDVPLPTEATCEDPEETEASYAVEYLGNDILSVSGAVNSYYAGAAHPSHGQTYKNIDLRTGTLITLDQLLKTGRTASGNVRDARETIKSSLVAQIGVQKVTDPVYDDQGRPVLENGKQQLATYPLTAEEKAMLTNAVNYVVMDDLPRLEFAIASGGLRFDLTNSLPHAAQALGQSYRVKFKAFERNGQLNLENDVVKRLLGK
jgi:hypothetical protein